MTKTTEEVLQSQISKWKAELLRHSRANNRTAAAECANIILGLLIAKDQGHD